MGQRSRHVCYEGSEELPSKVRGTRREARMDKSKPSDPQHTGSQARSDDVHDMPDAYEPISYRLMLT